MLQKTASSRSLIFPGKSPERTRGSEDYNVEMLSKETLETYRRMTPGERLALTFEMIRENTPYLLAGSPDVVDRRFELLRRENDLRNARLLAALQAMKPRVDAGR
jgi:hypothetical protein